MPVESYDDDDPRLRLSRAQWTAILGAILGESIAEIAKRCGVTPSRIRRWRETSLFRDATLEEVIRPTAGSFRWIISLMGVKEANAYQRERIRRQGTGDSNEQG